MTVRQLSDGVVEMDIGLIRLDIHVDDGAGAAEAARKGFRARFDSADANQDGYLEMDELSQDNGQPSPLAGLFKALDRDGDGKLYPRELDEFVAQAGGRGAGACDDDGLGRGPGAVRHARHGPRSPPRRPGGARHLRPGLGVRPRPRRPRDPRRDPAPHPAQSSTAATFPSCSRRPRAGPSSLASPGVTSAPPRPRPAAGPSWFRKMDRNRDGDVSPREFLGTREQFDRLDRDHDGLLSPDEAKEASAGRSAQVKAPGG